ncbi:hypothetical protein GALMADRAFT_223142 [Galerina marginata CBS 339.88]|uniref:Secreted protein n=1 Tax=Galerina marginata (strain CBS 339.88) TaxID=685588 RepID=A0A067TJZ4_GALM3|nr:hypothetical protein GALMADRAFT_223142 [Galerina marginata CBS 339.88]
MSLISSVIWLTVVGTLRLRASLKVFIEGRDSKCILPMSCLAFINLNPRGWVVRMLHHSIGRWVPTRKSNRGAENPTLGVETLKDLGLDLNGALRRMMHESRCVLGLDCDYGLTERRDWASLFAMWLAYIRRKRLFAMAVGSVRARVISQAVSRRRLSDGRMR